MRQSLQAGELMKKKKEKLQLEKSSQRDDSNPVVGAEVVKNSKAKLNTTKAGNLQSDKTCLLLVQTHLFIPVGNIGIRWSDKSTTPETLRMRSGAFTCDRGEGHSPREPAIVAQTERNANVIIITGWFGWMRTPMAFKIEKNK